MLPAVFAAVRPKPLSVVTTSVYCCYVACCICSRVAETLECGNHVCILLLRCLLYLQPCGRTLECGNHVCILLLRCLLYLQPCGRTLESGNHVCILLLRCLLYLQPCGRTLESGNHVCILLLRCLLYLQPCGRTLECGNHVCEARCHSGRCGACPRSGKRSCPCGKTGGYHAYSSLGSCLVGSSSVVQCSN